MATADSNNTRLFVLALGLLVGFVIGFVMLLSRIPVDTSLADYHATEVAPVQQDASDFEFYTVLEDKEVAKVATASTAAVVRDCLLYTSPSPRDRQKSRMPSSA